MSVVIYVDCEETLRQTGANVFLFDGKFYHAITLNSNLKIVLENHDPKRKIAVVRFENTKMLNSHGVYEFISWLDLSKLPEAP